MIIKELRLSNFRSHRIFSLHQPKQLIIITGNNATGKTNIIEAIQLLTMLESFRNPTWSALVGEDADKVVIKAEFLQNERNLEIQMDIEGGRRSYSLNGKKKNKADLVGLVPSIVFVPDDLALVKDVPEARRKLIDDTGQQLSSTYLRLLTDYHKTVRQRNKILKEHNKVAYNTLLLESWDDNLIVLGALLLTHRIRLYRRYMEKVECFYSQITQNELFSSKYIPSFSDPHEKITDEELVDMGKEEFEKKLKESLEKVRDLEWIRAKTMVGPHRDEIVFYIDGLEARKFASQGQQRSIALALKLGQLALIKEMSGKQPILLLDDVMSELDETRREALIKAIDGQMQTIITATDLSCFNKTLLENAQVIEL